MMLLGGRATKKLAYPHTHHHNAMVGMGRDEIHRLVSSVGQSRKNGVPWLNGQFGFGFHAFRGACQVWCDRVSVGVGDSGRS